MTQQIQTKQLSKGWKEESFAKCFKSISPTNKIPQKNYLSEGKLPVVDQGVNLVGGYINDNSKKQDVELPVIIFGDHTRRFKFINFDFVVGADGTKILKVNDFLDPKFFYYQCLTLDFPNKGYSRHFQYVKKTNFVFPTSLQTQRLIVSAIETHFSRLDNAIKNLKSVKEKIQLYRKAVLKKAFEKKEGWEEKKLGEVLDYEQPANYIVKTKILDEGKIPVLTPGKSFIKGYTNETGGIFNNLPTIIFDDFTTSNKFVTFPFKVKSSAMKILNPKKEDVDLKFIYYQMQTKEINSTTHKRYYLSIYSKLNFLFPVKKDGKLNYEEQSRIVSSIESKFSVIDKVEEAVENSLKKAEMLKKAILKAAFEGRLVKNE